MKICVDENIPIMTLRALQVLGHDVRDIRGTEHKGSSDAVLWEIAQQEERLLITTDKGFTQHRAEPHYGVLITRLRQPTRHSIHQRIMQAMAQFAPEEWPGLLAVMRDTVQSIWRSGGKPPLGDTNG
jgi:predicted nuclease of predicted toxin-antitoxin system